MCRMELPCWRNCWSWDCGFWMRWMRRGLRIFVVVPLLTVQGCSWGSSTREEIPVLPLLPSLQRLEFRGTPGLWMSSDDAGRLALWIYEVTGEAGL